MLKQRARRVLLPTALHYARRGSARWAVAANQALIERPRATTWEARGLTFEGDTTDLVARYLYVLGVWEPNLTGWIERRLRPGDLFVDVGANIGYFTLVAARRGAQVTAVEASPSIFRQLCRHLELNRLTARALNVAAAAEHGEATVFLADAANRGGTSTIDYGHGKREATVPAVPLAELLDDWSSVRLVKIDVEGAEFEALQGLLPALGSFAGELVVEVDPARLAQRGQRADELVDMLLGTGFHAYVLENSYDVRWIAQCREPLPASRLDRPIAQPTDLLFSRERASVLIP